MASDFVVYFDLETGGVEPHHPTIQIAAVAVDAMNAEVGTFEAKLTFDEGAADPEALRINHYDSALWTDACPPEKAVQKFAAWLRPFSSVSLVSKRGRPYNVARLAGYNAVAFDLPRLRALFGSSFFPCEYLVRDVLQRVVFFFDEHPELPRPENFKLSTVCAYFGIEVNGAHDALADARMTAWLHRAIGERL